MTGDVLRTLDTDDLMAMAAGAGLASRSGPPDRDRVVEGLARRYERPLWMPEAYQKLPRPAREIFAHFLWHGGSFPTNGPNVGVFGDSVALREGLGTLVRSGLLFPLRSTWGPDRYHIPDEARETLRGATLKVLEGDGPAILEREATSPSGGRGPQIVGEFVRILGHLHRTPVRLTNQGTIYKKDLEKMAGVLLPGALMSSSAWSAILPPVARSGITARLGWLLDAARDLNLLASPRPSQVTAHRQWVGRVGEMGMGGLWKSIVDVSLKGQRAPLGVPAHLLVNTLQESGDWFVPGRFMATRPGPALGHVREETRQFLAKLGDLGLIEAGWVENDAAVRMTQEGRLLLSKGESSWSEDQRFVCQGVTDVLAPPYLNPGVQARLETLAQLVKVDTSSRYRLSRELFWDALERGEEREQIRSFLDRSARGGLPQAMAFEVDGWIESYTRLAFAQPTLLYVEDPALLDQIASRSNLRKYVAGRIAPHHLILEEGVTLRAFRETLRREGIHVQPDVVRLGVDGAPLLNGNDEEEDDDEWW